MPSTDSSVPEKQETESISFRLSQRALDRLRELASQRKESLNSLVAQIIDKYLKLWVFDHSFGFFSVNMGILRSSLAKLNDKEIQQIVGEQALRAHKGIIMNLYGELNKETIVDYLDVFSTRFEMCKHFRKGKKHTITVFHGADSLQFSKLYYGIVKSILELAKIYTIESEREIDTDNFAISFETSV
jgi:hypothetical protein